MLCEEPPPNQPQTPDMLMVLAVGDYLVKLVYVVSIEGGSVRDCKMVASKAAKRG